MIDYCETSLSEHDQSMSLLSVHMGLEGVCQQRKAPHSLEQQEDLMTTRGRCVTLVRGIKSVKLLLEVSNCLYSSH